MNLAHTNITSFETLLSGKKGRQYLLTSKHELLRLSKQGKDVEIRSRINAQGLERFTELAALREREKRKREKEQKSRKMTRQKKEEKSKER